ncbi:hypothetical protein BLA29_011416 [Euroglyphus maynei]|uniref:Uncharacterized protein n=1 Tax=Euroglyphus maynei TaxID=6958 RepID=A0A1Y3B8C9_EURMA|nr:hypothetical protein BLA29_011416 [Euroglyphus maynei]
MNVKYHHYRHYVVKMLNVVIYPGILSVNVNQVLLVMQLLPVRILMNVWKMDSVAKMLYV